MLRIRRNDDASPPRRNRKAAAAAGDPDCAHHWHADEHGWHCCACPARARAGTDRPDNLGDCAIATCPAPADSPRHWLAPSPPSLPGRYGGSRPGRRRPHRPGDR